MRDQEIVGLYEAYASIYTPKEDEFQGWVNSLLEEGYDLSEYTWDDMYEIYTEEVEQLDELKAATDKNVQRVLKARDRRFNRSIDTGAPNKEFYQMRRSHRLAAKRNERRGSNVQVDTDLAKEETDLFDYILEYLVAEGFADTNENALMIMANMSEEWRHSIVEEVLDEALTGERLERAKEIIARNPKSAKAKAVKRVADSQEGSDRGDTVPGDLPRNRSNTTLPTGRGGRGRKGLGKTTNRPGHGAPLGGRTGESDRGKGNKAARRAGKEVEDTRYDN